MVNRIIAFIIIFLLFLVFSTETNAADFYTDTVVEYTFSESGETKIIQNITLENALTSSYAESYSMLLTQFNIKDFKAYESGKELPVDIIKTDEGFEIDIEFDEEVVGKGKQRNFRIEYTASTLAKKTGEVWEISIPKINSWNNYRSVETIVNVSNKLGTIAYVDPSDYELEEKNNYVSYTFEESAKDGITMAFGHFQVYSYVLNYHLENSDSSKGKGVIAIPPDTAYQKIFIDEIAPAPERIERDNDGNWLAYYDLSNNERLDIQVAGSAQLFSFPRNDYVYPETDMKEYLNDNKYWQTNDEKIQQLGKTYDTPRKIYDFVVSTLNYNYDRATPNTERLGAVKALESPDMAICMEFTDLFIAIARAAGIPAREVNGYAYTQNPRIQPLSLVADVLHAWPEYWDEARGIWVPVDPTWGKTSNTDYFDKIDLRHLVFVYHGFDSEYPLPPGSYKLGKNPQKDVFVNFSELPEERNDNVEITVNKARTLPFVPQKYIVKIKNIGKSAIYSKTVDIKSNDDLLTTIMVNYLLPGGEYDYTYTTEFSILGENIPNELNLEGIGTVASYKTNKFTIITYNLLSSLVIITMLVTGVIIKFKKASIFKKLFRQ